MQYRIQEDLGSPMARQLLTRNVTRNETRQRRAEGSSLNAPADISQKSGAVVPPRPPQLCDSKKERLRIILSSSELFKAFQILVGSEQDNAWNEGRPLAVWASPPATGEPSDWQLGCLERPTRRCTYGQAVKQVTKPNKRWPREQVCRILWGSLGTAQKRVCASVFHGH